MIIKFDVPNYYNFQEAYTQLMQYTIVTMSDYETKLARWLNQQYIDFYHGNLPSADCEKEFIEFLIQYRKILTNSKTSSPMEQVLKEMCYEKLDAMNNK
jgi:hypothetical protein